MSARDDFGSDSGRPGGRGGSNGGLANGGVGGGRGGGGGGGGAGRNGGYGSNTGLTTGNRWTGTTALGRPGGLARNPQAWGIRPQPTVSQAPLNRPTYPPSVQVPASLPGVNPVPQYPPSFESQYPNVVSQPWVDSIPGGWPGQSVTPQSQPTPQPGVDYHLGSTLNQGGYNSWSGNGNYPPGFGPDPHELSNRGWAGSRQDFNAVLGGGGIQGYNGRW